METLRINDEDPVNRDYPGNIGKVAWWLALPHLSGGPTWTDLLGNSKGTLTSMGNANNGWRGTSRPGGFGEMLFDGTAGNIAAGRPSALVGGFPAGITVACWVKLSTTSSALREFIRLNGSFILRTYDTLTNAPEFASWNGAGAGTLTRTPGTSGSLPAGQWSHVLATNNGANAKIYVNGNQNASATTLGSGAIPASSNSVFIGTTESGGEFLPGSLDSIEVWSRALSGPEAKAAYDQSILGYPDALNYY